MRPAPTLDGPTKPPVISQSGRGRAGVQTCRVLSVECECERARAWGGEILCTPSASVFPENMVQSVRKGASPEKFAGPRRTTAGERWPDISSAHGGGGRKKSPHMAFVAYEFSISSNSDDVSSSCNLPTPIIDSQFFVKNDPQQPKCLWRRIKFWEASPTHGPPTGSFLAWPKLLLA